MAYFVWHTPQQDGYGIAPHMEPRSQAAARFHVRRNPVSRHVWPQAPCDLVCSCTEARSFNTVVLASSKNNFIACSVWWPCAPNCYDNFTK